MTLDEYFVSQIRDALSRHLQDIHAPIKVQIGRIDTLEVQDYRQIPGVTWQANLYSPAIPGIKPNATGWIALDFMNFKVFTVPDTFED